MWDWVTHIWKISLPVTSSATPSAETPSNSCRLQDRAPLQCSQSSKAVRAKHVQQHKEIHATWKPKVASDVQRSACLDFKSGLSSYGWEERRHFWRKAESKRRERNLGGNDQALFRNRVPLGKKQGEPLQRGAWVKHGKSQTKDKPHISGQENLKEQERVTGSKTSARTFPCGSGAKGKTKQHERTIHLYRHSCTLMWLLPACSSHPNFDRTI